MRCCGKFFLFCRFMGFIGLWFLLLLLSEYVAISFIVFVRIIVLFGLVFLVVLSMVASVNAYLSCSLCIELFGFGWLSSIADIFRSLILFVNLVSLYVLY
jgi:hypothetical protein